MPLLFVFIYLCIYIVFTVLFVLLMVWLFRREMCMPAFCLNIPHFSCRILYYSMGWAQPSLIPPWLMLPCFLVSCKSRAAPGFGLHWKTSAVVLYPTPEAFCSLLGLCLIRLLRHVQHPRAVLRVNQGLLQLVNLKIQAAAHHSAPLLQDSTSAALLFFPEKNCLKKFFGTDEGSRRCPTHGPFWMLWSHPEKIPHWHPGNASGGLCEWHVLTQQTQIYRKNFVKRQAISF